MARRYSRSASKDVERAMKKRKRGTLKSGGSGRKVKSRKQAIAIGLSEARAKGKKVPKRRRAAASRRKVGQIAALGQGMETPDQQHRIERDADREPDPDPDGAAAQGKAEQIARRESDHPEAERGDQRAECACR